MKQQFKLGIIGGGFMAQAIVKGAVNSGFLRAGRIFVADISQTALDTMEYFGVRTTTDCREVAKNCEYVIMAVKPQNFEEVANTLYGIPMRRVISIMAGVTRERIRDLLCGDPLRIARVMPNLPCSIGEGISALDLLEFMEFPDDCDFVAELFENVGTFVVADQEELNAITGISGSGPAYVYLFIKALTNAGVKQGLREDKARTLAVSTVAGAAKMVEQSEDKTLDELLNAVCSKGGTTIEAVHSLQNDNLDEIIDRAVSACVKRAEELSE